MFTWLLAVAVIGPPVDLSKISQEAFLPQRGFSDDVLPHACTPKELARLESETRKIARIDADEAWHLVLTLLCGTSDASNAWVLQHMPERYVRETWPSEHYDEGKYDPDRVWRAKTSDVMLRGFAYDVAIEANKAGDVVVVWSSFPCTDTFLLRRAANAWLVVETTEACD